MKNISERIRRTLGGATLALIFMTLLSSCGDIDVWAPSGPTGWDFQDQRLTGYWQLANVNGEPVGGYKSNFLEFYGDGSGRYYYYRNATPRSERIAYWCQNANSGYSRYQINIQYQSGQASTMNYWFSDSGRTLYMRWNSSNGIYTYAYARVSGVNW